MYLFAFGLGRDYLNKFPRAVQLSLLQVLLTLSVVNHLRSVSEYVMQIIFLKSGELNFDHHGCLVSGHQMRMLQVLLV